MHVFCMRFTLHGQSPLVACHAMRHTNGSCTAACVRRAPNAYPPFPKPFLPKTPQVQELQTALASVSEAPGLGLSEAADLLLKELGVDLVR